MDSSKVIAAVVVLVVGGAIIEISGIGGPEPTPSSVQTANDAVDASPSAPIENQQDGSADVASTAPQAGIDQSDGAPTADQVDAICARQPPSDGYAPTTNDCTRAIYQQKKAEFISSATMVFEAQDCQVILPYQGLPLATMMNDPSQIIEAQLKAGVEDINPGTMLALAEKKASAEAQSPGGCDYWKQNPRAVNWLREKAQMAMSMPMR